MVQKIRKEGGEASVEDRFGKSAFGSAGFEDRSGWFWRPQSALTPLAMSR
jgi:hypothetical protein